MRSHFVWIDFFFNFACIMWFSQVSSCLFKQLCRVLIPFFVIWNIYWFFSHAAKYLRSTFFVYTVENVIGTCSCTPHFAMPIPHKHLNTIYIECERIRIKNCKILNYTYYHSSAFSKAKRIKSMVKIGIIQYKLNTESWLLCSAETKWF